MKPDPNKLQGIMYLIRPTTKTKSLAIIGMVEYYTRVPGGLVC